VQLRSNREIAIHVPDLARAEAFYGKLLGFRLIRRSLDQLEFDTGELRLYVNRDTASLIPYIHPSTSTTTTKHGVFSRRRDAS